MKLFECQNCGQLLYFENTRCERCGHLLGYISGQTQLSALEATGDGRWRSLGDTDHLYRYCENSNHDACNWMIPADSPDIYCRACRLNRTIPDISDPGRKLLWRRLEAAKHRLVYGLLRLNLPVVSAFEEPGKGLAFDFLADTSSAAPNSPPVVTGHQSGVITIDLAEADHVERERQRRDMVESYRTPLGHFRHEVGHYYWLRLVQGGVWQDAFRSMFGDERRDYSQALASHYATGPRADWPQHFVSAYAAAHPWEDFAETWAHFLHIVDTLETAHAFGLGLHARAGRNPGLSMEIEFDPYRQADFDALVDAWMPLTAAVNSLNASMGLQDLYPFVLTPAVVGKLRFVHGLVHGITAH